MIEKILKYLLILFFVLCRITCYLHDVVILYCCTSPGIMTLDLLITWFMIITFMGTWHLLLCYIPRDHVPLYHTCSSYYYIFVNPMKSIIMDIICNNWTTYIKMGETDGINMRTCLKWLNIVQLKLRFYFRTTRWSGGCIGTPTPNFIPSRAYK